MKNYLRISSIVSFLLLAILLTSCGTTVYQLKTDCNKDTEDLFKAIAMALSEENFLIKQNDAKLGYLQAETIPSFNIWIGANEIRYWVFQKVEDKVTASAKVAYITQNVFGATTGGSETYYNDKTHKDWTWYWSVRNKIENVCGNKIVFVEKKVH